MVGRLVGLFCRVVSCSSSSGFGCVGDCEVCLCVLRLLHITTVILGLMSVSSTSV